MLRGDLDNIALKALQKEPERRYATVEKLSEDIDRHLQGLPIKARPNTFTYRTEKFIKRNYLGVIAGLLIVLSLLGGAAATIWQSHRAEQQRSLAQKRFSDVRQLANSFLFEVYPQIEKLEGATTARETLVKRALEYLDSLAQESADDAGLQHELAAAYEKVSDVQGNPNQSNLGDTKGALESSQKAQKLRELLSSQNPANADLRHELATNLEETGVLLWWSDETAKAVEEYDEALEIRRALVTEKPDSIEYQKGLADLQMDYGDVPAWNNESEKALEHYLEAQKILENLVNKKAGEQALKEDLGRALIRVGRTQKDVKDFDSATFALDNAQKIFESLAFEDPNNYDFGRGLWKVKFGQCEMYLVKPDNKRAVESCSQLIVLAESLVKKDSKDTLMKHDLVSSYNYAGDAFMQSNLLNEAVSEFNKGLAINAELAEEYPDNTEYKRNIAVMNMDSGKANLQLGKANLALENNQKARRIFEEIVAEDQENSVPQFNLATAYQQLGETYLSLRNSSEARNWFIHALNILKTLKEKGLLASRDEALIPKLQGYITQIR